MAVTLSSPRGTGKRTAAGLGLLVVVLAGGCATPVSAPGGPSVSNPTVSPMPVGGTPAATEAAAKAPANTATPDATAKAGELSTAALGALVGVEERVQAVELRINKLAATKDPTSRETELTAAVNDLASVADQLTIVRDGADAGDEAGRQDRASRMAVVLTTLVALMRRLDELPGLAGSSEAARLKDVESRIEQLRTGQPAAAGTPTP